jgi:class 3 adenylate cyclase
MMIVESSHESNIGLARRRRRSSKTLDDSRLTRSLLDHVVVEEEDDEPADIGTSTGDNTAGGGNDSLGRSSSGNYLDALLQTASAAMGLTPVRNSNDTNGSNGDLNDLLSLYTPANNKGFGNRFGNRPRRRASITTTNGTDFHTSNNHHNNDTTKNRDSFELKQNAIHSLQSDGTLEQISALERLQAEQQYTSSQNLWSRLAIRSSHPDVSQKELIQRSTFLVISSLTVGAGTLWGGMYVILGEWTAALMPFIYSTCMSLVLVTFIFRSDVMDGMMERWKKKYQNKMGGIGSSIPTPLHQRLGCLDSYDIFVECQLGLIMACPFAVHIALGGVENSGGVMLWSFLCPMGAAFFRSAQESLLWFWIYLGISALLLAVEIGYAETSSQIISQVYFLMNIMGCMGVIFSAVFLFARELEREYTKSEEVLLNILPSKIVKRIKRGEFPIVDHVSSVTILFADLVGFTKASAELHPNFLVGLFLRDIFHAFDELAGKHGLEKIKTIGDAYMVVGGLDHSDGEEENRRRRSSMNSNDGELPSHGDNGDHHHPTSIMLLALDMFRELTRINKKYNLNFCLRIGVHKGPVVAGVLGLKRFTYDVWGDSVNVSGLILFPCVITVSSGHMFVYYHYLTLVICFSFRRLPAEWNQMEYQT